MTQKHKLSIVVPVYNEADSLEELHEELQEVISNMDIQSDVIFVNDGSNDNSLDILRKLSKQDSSILVINFVANYGKASALQAAFDSIDSKYAITMDADLQDDPAMIPSFFEKLNNTEVDVVTGWKIDRLDPKSKTLPSKVANKITRMLSGVKIHDMNCGFKLYTKPAYKSLLLRGDYHRFIPALLAAKGFKIDEIEVNHRKRKYGKSKYGIGRLFTSALDFVAIILLTKFVQKPFHFFGMLGLISLLVSALTLLYLFIIWLTQPEPIGDRPLFLVSLMTFALGIQIIVVGLISELILNNKQSRDFIIKEKTNHKV